MWGLGAKIGPKNQILKQGDSFLIHSIRLDEIVILVYSFVKIGWKMAKLWPWEARAAKWRYPILGHKTAILATFFEIWTSNLFCPAFTLTLIYKPSLKSIRPKLAILSPKKTHQSGHISKPHFAQVSFTKKPTPPTFFNEFVWNFQNRCKYGFCTY